MTSNEKSRTIRTDCCIVGGGPAGLVSGFLLARAGIKTLVIEKHKDFFRDFRGDTVHPSTLQLMEELGLLSEFLKIPHQEVRQLGVDIGRTFFMISDFSQLSTTCKFIALMPQWDFLNFIAEKAKLYQTFNLQMSTEAVELIKTNDRVTGLKAKTAHGEIEIECSLVIGADGRNSKMRDCSKLNIEELGAPMDVLWFRIPRTDKDPPQTMGRANKGMIFIMLNREKYWQCGFVIEKGSFDAMRNRPIDEFRQSILNIAPFLRDRRQELNSWDEIKLLTVKVDRLKQWSQEGLIFIGDAAHAMSPIGGVGINLAIQDAVAAANLLWQPLLQKNCTIKDLEKVQRRRLYPTKATQALQVFLQNHAVKSTLTSRTTTAPLFFKLFNIFPPLRYIPAYLIGIGFRAEHIQSPDISSTEEPHYI